jgi:hypothetical protein
MFYLVWEIKNTFFFFSSFYVADPGSASKDFRYKFTIRKSDECISVCGISHSYLKDKGEILQPGKCVALHYDTVLKYLNEGRNLLCEIEVPAAGVGGDEHFLRRDKWGNTPLRQIDIRAISSEISNQNR